MSEWKSVEEWHRQFAIDASNRAWTLSEMSGLDGAQMGEMLLAAYAAAYHWGKVGGEEQHARADLLLARAHAILGDCGRAREHADAAFQSITSRDAEPWEVAFAHAMLANAAAVCGDAAKHALFHASAAALGDALEEDEERALFHATFDLIPPPKRLD